MLSLIPGLLDLDKRQLSFFLVVATSWTTAQTTSSSSLTVKPAAFDPFKGDEFTIAQNGPLSVTLPTDFEIKFTIRPRSVVAEWTNVLHFSADKVNLGPIQCRMPAVWFNPSFSSLYFGYGSRKNPSFGVNTPVLPLNVYTRVSIIAKNSTLKIFFNTSELVSEDLPADRASGPAFFYLSDTWSSPAKAQIKEVVIKEFVGSTIAPTETISRLERSPSTVVTVPQDYEIGFVLIPRNILSTWSNLFHYTAQDVDNGVVGARMPAAFMAPGTTQISVHFGAYSNADWSLKISESLPRGARTNVTIRARGRDVRVFYNGTLKATAIAPSDRPSGKAYFYMSSPWFPPADVLVEKYYLTELKAETIAVSTLRAAAKVSVVNATVTNQTVMKMDPKSVFVPSDYELRFLITPINTTNVTSNVLHYTASNADESNMPGVWFRANSTRLMVRPGAVSGNNKWEVVTNSELPLNQSTWVTIIAKGRSVKVFFGSQEVASGTAPGDRPFGKAFFYDSDPWYPSALALLDTVSLTEYTALVRTPAAKEIALDQSKALITEIPMNYKLSIDIKPSSRPDRWSNVFHFSSTGLDFGPVGSRMPALWFLPSSGELQFIFGSQNDSNWGVRSRPLPLNVYTRVSIQTAGKLVAIYYNDSLVSKTWAPSERPFGRASFFLSDPWYSPAPATVKDLSVDELHGGLLPVRLTDCEIALEAFKEMGGVTKEVDGCRLPNITLSTTRRITKINWSGRSLFNSISPLLGYLTELDSIILANNSISGEIPATLDNVFNLTEFNVANNQLNGSFPVVLPSIRSLVTLVLAKNSLSGGLPKEINRLRSLRTLNLNGNKFTGAVPVELSDLVDLRELGLGSNLFEGPVPDSFGRLTSLTRLNLENNHITRVNPWIGGLPELIELRLSGNDITIIPDGWGKWPKLQTLSVFPNPITSIPFAALARVPGSEVPESLMKNFFNAQVTMAKRQLTQATTSSLPRASALIKICPLTEPFRGGPISVGCLSGIANLCKIKKDLIECQNLYHTVFTNSKYAELGATCPPWKSGPSSDACQIAIAQLPLSERPFGEFVRSQIFTNKAYAPCMVSSRSRCDA